MSDTVYALYTCLKATRGFRDLDLDDAAQEVENLFKEWDPSVTVRGVYSTVGFRADTDLMLWFVGPTADAVQDALVAFRRTRAGRELDQVAQKKAMIERHLQPALEAVLSEYSAVQQEAARVGLRAPALTPPPMPYRGQAPGGYGQ